MPAAALAVDDCNEVVDRSSLSSSNFRERSPEWVFQGHAGLTAADLDASFDNLRFPDVGLWIA
jgi:hypothetical protein